MIGQILHVLIRVAQSFVHRVECIRQLAKFIVALWLERSGHAVTRHGVRGFDDHLHRPQHDMVQRQVQGRTGQDDCRHRHDHDDHAERTTCGVQL